MTYKTSNVLFYQTNQTQPAMFIKYLEGPKKLDPIQQSSIDPHRGVSITLKLTNDQRVRLQKKKILKSGGNKTLDRVIVISVKEYNAKGDHKEVSHNGYVMDGFLKELKYSAISNLSNGAGEIRITIK